MVRKFAFTIALIVISLNICLATGKAEPPSTRESVAANLKIYCRYLYFRSWQAGGCNVTGTEMRDHVLQFMDDAGFLATNRESFAEQAIRRVLEPVCCTYWQGFDRSKQDEMLGPYLKEIEKLVDSFFPS